jgi:hypothetical protein
MVLNTATGVATVAHHKVPIVAIFALMTVTVAADGGARIAQGAHPPFLGFAHRGAAVISGKTTIVALLWRDDIGVAAERGANGLDEAVGTRLRSADVAILDRAIGSAAVVGEVVPVVASLIGTHGEAIPTVQDAPGRLARVLVGNAHVAALDLACRTAPIQRNGVAIVALFAGHQATIATDGSAGVR